MIPFLDRDEYYELLELTTANHIGAYATEAEALADVRDALRRYGRPGAATLGLAYRDPHGGYHAVAEGDALIARAEAAATTGIPGTLSET